MARGLTWLVTILVGIPVCAFLLFFYGPTWQFWAVFMPAAAAHIWAISDGA